METCIATPTPDEPSPPAGRNTALRGVLLVVDDPDLQARLAKRFGRTGYRVVGAPSAEAAAAVCTRWSPDVVLIDETVRGGHSGREIARALQLRVPSLRAVILGASEGTFEKVDAIAAATAALLTEVAAASRNLMTSAAASSARVAPAAGAVTSSGRKAESGRRSRSSAPRR
ncbi:MAG: hypothetical protein IT379_41580 [Deltaproteobacteria bacterium]|nr:hypothetical protein [Deltaproteobacteria bacterium]